MNISRRNLAICAAILSTAAIGLAIYSFLCFLIAAIALLCAGIVTMSMLDNFHEKKFNRERKAAMEAAENLSRSLEFYERDLPLDRYSRFLFTRAVDNAHNVGISVRIWITIVHQNYSRSSNQHSGLQLKDVPAFIDNINNQVREAFIYIREGSKGAAPKILDIFWFDQSTLCGNELSIHPSCMGEYSPRPTLEHYEHYKQLARVFPTLRAVPSTEVLPGIMDLNNEALTTGNTADGITLDACRPPVVTPVLTIVPKATAMARAMATAPASSVATVTDSKPLLAPDPAPAPQHTPPLLLTYDPSEPPEIACTFEQFEALRNSRKRGNVDIVKSEVMPFDTSKRKARR